MHLVESMDEVLTVALDGELTPLSKTGVSMEEAAPDSPIEPGPVAH